MHKLIRVAGIALHGDSCIRTVKDTDRIYRSVIIIFQIIRRINGGRSVAVRIAVCKEDHNAIPCGLSVFERNRVLLKNILCHCQTVICVGSAMRCQRPDGRLNIAPSCSITHILQGILIIANV